MIRFLVDASYGSYAPRVGSEVRVVDGRSFPKQPRIVLTIPKQRESGAPDDLQILFDLPTARRLRRLIGFAIEDARELER